MQLQNGFDPIVCCLVVFSVASLSAFCTGCWQGKKDLGCIHTKGCGVLRNLLNTMKAYGRINFCAKVFLTSIPTIILGLRRWLKSNFLS